MGRRPNPLMAEFFERGNKLDDASNRYEQTCRRCGEYFARGRSEAMVTHLTKRCPAVSNAERTKIILRLHDLSLPEVHPYIDPTFKPQTTESDERAAEQDKNDNNASLPLGQNRQHFDGLNVLAEASRRVGSNARGNTGSTSENPDGLRDQISRPQEEDATLDPQLQAGVILPPILHDNGTDVQGNAFPTSTPENLPPLYHYMGHLPPASQGSLAGLPIVSTHPQDLSTIAATAHATIDNGSIMATDLDMSDELHENGFPSQGRQSYPWPATLGAQPMEPLTMSPPTQAVHSPDLASISSREIDGHPSQNEQPISQSLRPIAMNPNGRPQLSDNTDSDSQTPKAKVRGQFAPDRRKEVKVVRKLGACMRCRMLKKTCSPETPCQTCYDIGSPRLWKFSCVRTRLNKAFPLYFLGLYGVLAHQEVNLLKTRVSLSPFSGRIEGFHFAHEKIVMKGLHSEQVAESAPAGDSHVSDSSHHPLDDEVIVVADLDTDNLLPKIERYLQAIFPKLMGQEPSSTMRASLQIAQTIKERQQSSVTADKQDNLISDVIELWTATSMLTDVKLKASFATDTGLEDGRTLISEATMRVSYRVLTLQLQAAVEKRAGILCRSVMNHFEQRVLSRRKSNNFETFLVAFVLLNCVERMCWSYRRWDWRCRELGVHWPLDQKPAYYADKGETFARMIQMLINLRQLEPKITVDANSALVVPFDSDDDAVAEWLFAAGFTTDLTAKFALAMFDPEDSRSLDGAFFGRLLQTQEPAS